ncbi:hypothetical protein D3C72_911520 [compost metagenome]
MVQKALSDTGVLLPIAGGQCGVHHTLLNIGLHLEFGEKGDDGIVVLAAGDHLDVGYGGLGWSRRGEPVQIRIGANQLPQQGRLACAGCADKQHASVALLGAGHL